MTDTECHLDDDGMPSGDFIAVEAEDADGSRQSLWVGVRPVFHGNKPSREPMIQICYQEKHMGGPLAGPVWLTPAVWRQLNRAVEWRLQRKLPLHRRVLAKLTGA